MRKDEPFCTVGLAVLPGLGWSRTCKGARPPAHTPPDTQKPIFWGPFSLLGTVFSFASAPARCWGPWSITPTAAPTATHTQAGAAQVKPTKPNPFPIPAQSLDDQKTPLATRLQHSDHLQHPSPTQPPPPLP